MCNLWTGRQSCQYIHVYPTGRSQGDTWTYKCKKLPQNRATIKLMVNCKHVQWLYRIAYSKPKQVCMVTPMTGIIPKTPHNIKYVKAGISNLGNALGHLQWQNISPKLRKEGKLLTNTALTELYHIHTRVLICYTCRQKQPVHVSITEVLSLWWKSFKHHESFMGCSSVVSLWLMSHYNQLVSWLTFLLVRIQIIHFDVKP